MEVTDQIFFVPKISILSHLCANENAVYSKYFKIFEVQMLQNQRQIKKFGVSTTIHRSIDLAPTLRSVENSVISSRIFKLISN